MAEHEIVFARSAGKELESFDDRLAIRQRTSCVPAMTSDPFVENEHEAPS